jgi:hypothetical protein
MELGNPMYCYKKDFTYRTFLLGHEKLSKNVISQTMSLILGVIKLK